MKFERIQHIVGKEAVFETGLLLAGDVDPASVRRQLSRLVASGRLLQLRRGLYALAPPYQKSRPHPFLVANRIMRPSYVSLQSALAHHGLIPEHVPVVTSITTSRPGRWSNPLGDFEYRHIKTALFFGYRLEEVGEGQQALIAAPEKALLDLIYLHAVSDRSEYLRELRLQNMETLDLGVLGELAGTSGSAKLHRAVRLIRQMVLEEAVEYETI